MRERKGEREGGGGSGAGPSLAFALAFALVAGCTSPSPPSPTTVPPPRDGGGFGTCHTSAAQTLAVDFRADATKDARGHSAGLHRLTVNREGHRQLRRAPQHVGQLARVRRVEVQHHEHRGRQVGGQRGGDLAQRIDSAD